MDRIKNLGKYQKMVLMCVIVIILIFSVIYIIVINRKGFLYRNRIMIPKQGENETVYYATYDNQMAQFTVKNDGSVSFSYMDELWGPCVLKNDSSAIPSSSDLKDLMTGFELYCDGELIFRGAYATVDPEKEIYWIYDENGSEKYSTDQIYVTDTDDIWPSVPDIIRLLEGPVLRHKGNIGLYFLGLFISIITMISVIFADDLFRRHLSFMIKHPEDAEPSEAEMTGRYFTWIIFPIIALAFFITGLK